MNTLNLRSFIWFATGVAMTVTSISIFGAWRVNADVTPIESTFVPVAPCRLMDTRPDTQVGPRSTPLAETPYTQAVVGTNGDCTIPLGATAVSMNVTAIAPTAASFLTVYPSDAVDRPTASNLNFVAGQAPTPNKVDVKLSATGTIDFFNRFGTVDVIADVVGYYSSSGLEQLQAEIDAVKAMTPPDPAALGNLVTDITDLQDQATASAAALTTLGDDVAALLGRIDAADAATSAVVADLATLQSEVTAAVATLTTLSADLATLQAQVATNTASIATVANDLGVAQTQIAANVTALTDLTADLTALQTDVTANATALSTLQTDVTANDNAITAIETDVTANATALSTLQTDVAANATALSTLQTDVATNATALSTLQTDVTANATALGTLQTDVTANDNAITAIETDVTSLLGDTADIPAGVTVTGQETALSTALSTGVREALANPVRLPGRAAADIAVGNVGFAGFAALGIGIPADDAACTGTFDAPTAPAGKLCIYFVDETNVELVAFEPAILDNRRFFSIAVTPIESTMGNTVQAALLIYTWAYTA